jgi:hypothetical protein
MNADKSELIDAELTERVIGIFYSVHNELGFRIEAPRHSAGA